MYWDCMVQVQVFQLISSLAFSSASKLFETPVISNRAVTHKQTCNSHHKLDTDMQCFFLGTEYLQ